MQLLDYIITALTVALLPLVASASAHFKSRNHQGVARRADGHVLDSRAQENSRWSWYDTQTGNAGSCGRMLQNSEFVVAMNVPQYQGGNCFKYITLSWRGNTTRAQIVDMCPGCGYGGLDLSPALFQFFTPLGTGLLHDGSWWFDGDDPQAPSPHTTTTFRWTPPPTPTPKTTATWAKPTTSSTPSPTPTPISTPTTSTQAATPPSSSARPSSSSTSWKPTSTVPLLVGATPTSTGNLGSILQFSVAMAELIINGARAA